MTDIDLLFAKLQKEFTDTTTMKMPEPDKRIKGQAFFPGGTGTLDGSENLKGKDVMILGQDFDTHKNFEKSFEKGGENNSTWRNIKRLLNEANISESRCFFTNAVMGFRKEGKNTGSSPAFNDTAFMEKCKTFFLYQLEIQKPQVIFALGIQVAKFLASIAEIDLDRWKNVKSFGQIDTEDAAVKTKVHFTADLTANIILLIHPSFRLSNVWRRKFGNATGHNAELEMIKSVIKS